MALSAKWVPGREEGRMGRRRGADENSKCYERTYQLIESIDIPFLESARTNQAIENTHDRPNNQPSC